MNPQFMDFTTGLAGGTCGNTFRNTDGTGTPLKNLTCGGLNIGGGLSTVGEGPTPDGSTNRFTLSCAGSSCTIGPVLQDGSSYDCTNTGCRFGTPLPIPNALSPGLSTCVANTFAAPASGTLDTSTGISSVSVSLTSRSIVTGNLVQPCPICRIGTIAGAPCAGTPASPCTGVCEGSPNQGAACTSTNSVGLSRDCPAPDSNVAGNKCYRGSSNGAACTNNANCPGGACAIFVGNIPVDLSPLTTGTAQMAAADGVFCKTKRCLGGSNYGNVCTVDADCPGTTVTPRCVSQENAITRSTGAFISNVCLGGTNDGAPCTVNGDCNSNTCRGGNVNNFCSGGAGDGKGCTGTTQCPAPGVCSKAGTFARLVREMGVAAGPMSIGVPTSATLATVFCIPATNTDPNGAGNGALINGAASLPGPGATSLPGTITLLP